MKDTPWVKAERSNNQEGCVEQRRHGGRIEIGTRRTKGPVLVLRFTKQ